jgi:hypothetical protein
MRLNGHIVDVEAMMHSTSDAIASLLAVREALEKL